MWSGDYTNIPDGWVPCDGQNGTPNLTDRFVRMASIDRPPHYQSGTTTHTHTVNISPASHNHAGSAQSNNDGLAGGPDIVDSSPAGYYSQATYGHEHQLNIDPHSHTHSNWAKTATHIPPYYVLIYIMKL